MKYQVNITGENRNTRSTEVDQSWVETFHPKEAEALNDPACRGSRTTWELEDGTKAHLYIEKKC